MSTDIQNDGFFSERSYDAANQLATTIGRIFTSISQRREPDWSSARSDIANRKMLLLIFGENAADHIKARIDPFLLIEPLVMAKERKLEKWAPVLERIMEIFPAYNASAIESSRPNFTREMAETEAFLLYSGKRAA